MLHFGRILGRSLIAVIAGNLIYFFLVMPRMPIHARHQVYRLDLGLLIDFWICVAVFGILQLVSRRPR